MAETDILNPAPMTIGDWASVGLSFNPNPSYGFSRKMTNNRLLQRPRLGTFITRDIGNAGHIFPLSWVNTDLSTAQRVTRFYHDFKNGYFTFINIDWEGRHFVGRFTAEPEAIHTGNGKYTIQGATFEEVPTARMLQYPNDWTNDGHPLNVVDDFFPNGVPNTRVALMQGAWITQLSPALSSPSPTDPTAYEAFDATPASGDWAQTQYTGWGFKMAFRMGASLGAINILLDGVQIVTTLDLSSGTSASLSSIVALTTAVVAGTTFVTVTLTNVPLDMHRVKVVYAGASTAGGYSIVFPALQYIY